MFHTFVGLHRIYFVFNQSWKVRTRDGIWFLELCSQMLARKKQKMITIHNRHTESVRGLWDGFWPCPVQQICNTGYIGGSNLYDPLNGWSWAAHGHLGTTKHSTHIRSSSSLLRMPPHDISGGCPPSSHLDGTWPGLPSRDDTTFEFFGTGVTGGEKVLQRQKLMDSNSSYYESSKQCKATLPPLSSPTT